MFGVTNDTERRNEMEKDTILSFLFGIAALFTTGVFVFLLSVIKRKILEYIKKQIPNN